MMLNFYRVFIFIIGGLFCAPAYAENSLTLMDAFLNAYARDARVKAARAAFDASREGVNFVSTFKKPKINSTGALAYSEIGALNINGNPQSEGVRGSFGLEIEQPLYSFGRNDARYNEATAKVMVSQNVLVKTEQEVLAEVASAYIDALRSEKMMDVLSGHVTNMRELLRVSEAKFQEQLVTEIDVLLVKARLAQGEAELSIAQSEHKSALNSLTRLTGLEGGQLSEVSLQKIMSIIPVTLDELLLHATHNTPDLAIAKAQLSMAEAALNLQRSDRWPRASITGRVARGFIGQRNVKTDEIGLQFSVPLYDAGVSNSQIQSKKHAVNEARQQMSYAEQLAEQLTRSYFSQLEGLEISWRAWQEAVATEDKALLGLYQQVEEGVKHISDYLESKERALDNRRSEIGVYYQIFVQKFKLMEAVGQLNRGKILTAP